MSGQLYPGQVIYRVVKALAATSVLLAAIVASARADEAAGAASDSTVPKVSKDAAKTASSSSEAQEDHVRALIHDLGNPRFSARRAAAIELRQIGPEAFDLLNAATDDADPEVAASAGYLLRQIAVRWVQPEDSATVRAFLRQYGQEADNIRSQRIEQLAKLPQNAGVVALTRIVRFDRSPILSRSAAIAIIRPKDLSSSRPSLDAAAIQQQLGASTRPPATWLRQYLAQQHDRAASIKNWTQLIEQESARLDKASETNNEIVLGLEWNLAELYRQTGDTASINAVLDRIAELAGDGAEDTLVDLLKWLTENKAWNTLDTFLDKHQAQLAQNKRPLYYAALARALEGKHELADQLAADAAAVQPQGRLESFSSARDMEEHGQFDWAVREYRRAIEKQPSDTGEPFLARLSLANLFHDYEREQDAAEVLEPLVKSVQGDNTVSQLYSRIRDYYNGRVATDLPDPDGIAARYHFYRACQYQAEKDLTRAKDEYDLSLQFNQGDADVLIGAYHFPQGDAKWHDAVRQRVRKLVQQFQQQIDEDPADATPYNQWAWIVSNTEGDLQRALRYSQRSLELNLGGDSVAGGYLDTLGRCYYALGDYENAVKCEREAIEKVSYPQVMRRQLELFEKALIDKKAGKAPPAETSK
ncbi:MAG TPA: hypothetical protein VH107_15005 [Lacipirellulaceae bacterium]|jgi:hypothetical protein|nr:hypothetical protein [Lacipirellulaceae bacterium]